MFVACVIFLSDSAGLLADQQNIGKQEIRAYPMKLGSTLGKTPTMPEKEGKEGQF